MDGSQSLGLVFGLLGVPENIRALWQIAENIIGRIRIWRGAPEFLAEFRETCTRIYTGNLATLLQLAEASMIISDDKAFAERVQIHEKRIRQELDAAHEVISKSFPTGQRNVDREYFTAYGEHRLRTIDIRLHDLIQEFSAFITDQHNANTHLSGRTLLDSQRFQETSEFSRSSDFSRYCKPVPVLEHLWQGTAEFRERDGSFYHGEVFYESWYDDKIPLTEAGKMLACLAAQLSHEQRSDAGILRCLGWREEPRLELVFQGPPGLTYPRSLRSLLCVSSVNGRHQVSRRDRGIFAQKVAEAVLAVISRNLVHKRLFPESILIFAQRHSSGAIRDPDVSNAQPVLSDWRMARTIHQASARRGSHAWQTNIYCHPRRQGLLLPEHRYHFGYDIYSLGVLLLEIGIWDPLVIVGEHEDWNLSDAYQNSAIRLDLAQREDERFLDKIIEPANCTQILKSLARDKLPSEMGEDYTRVVLGCIHCIENGFFGVTDFVGQAPQVLHTLKAEVITPLIAVR